MILKQLGFTPKNYHTAPAELADKHGLTPAEATKFANKDLIKDDLVGISYGVLNATDSNGKKNSAGNDANVTLTEVKPDPVNPIVTNFEGWGTSLVWYANVIGGWSEASQKLFSDMIFDKEKGLGFNIARYNIGGGENPNCEYNKAGNETHLRLGGLMPGFKASENSAYDWNADKNQRNMLLLAKERGANIFEAFSNSPPYWMTQSGCVSGNKDSKKNNLKDDYYDKFAGYLVDVVAYYKDKYDISFRTLDPLNESLAEWWPAGGGQEGCHFDIDKQAKIINSTAKALTERGLSDVKLSATDENTIDWTIDAFNKYDDATKSKIGQINAHSYGGNMRSELRELAQKNDKKLWMSEVGIGNDKPHNHDTIPSALELSNKIIDDMGVMGPQAWVYWQVVEDELNMAKPDVNMNWGLIHTDFSKKDSPCLLTKQYYAMEQFSKFIRPGYNIIKSGNENTLAAYSDADKKLIIVCLNDSSEAKNVKLDLSKFSGFADEIQRYRTSPGDSFKKLDNVKTNGNSLLVGLVPQSINTFVISGASNQSNTLYFVDAGDSTVNTFEQDYDKPVYNSVEEQEYKTDEKTFKKWGYVVDGGKDKTSASNGSDSKYLSVREYTGDAIGKGLHYKFEIPNGEYNVKIGFNDTRYQDVIIEGNAMLKDYLVGYNQEKVFPNIKVSDKELNIDFLKSRTGDKGPIVSWIAVEGDMTKPENTVKDGIIGTELSKYSGTNVGAAPALDKTAIVKYNDGTTKNVSILWENISKEKYSTEGCFNVLGKIQGTELLISSVITVLPKNLVYYVDCGSDETKRFEAMAEKFNLLNSVADQKFGGDAITTKKWGYETYQGKTWAQTGITEFDSLRTDEGDTAGQGLVYKFDINNGTYNVMLGFKDPWGNKGRKQDVFIQDKNYLENYNPPSANDMKTYNNIKVDNGVLKISILRSKDNTGKNEDPIINVIKIFKVK